MTTVLAALTPDRAVALTRPKFDAVTIAMHWATVLLVIGLFAVGLALATHQAPNEATVETLLTLHRSLGVSVWTLSAVRLAWRANWASFPPWPQSMGSAQRLAARFSEYGLYALLMIQPLTGTVESLSRGHPFELFFVVRVPALMARNGTIVHLFEAIHEWGAWLFAAVIGVHAAAGLLHRFILRDGVFQSMSPFSRGPARSA
jgi:cytochrome b561